MIQYTYDILATALGALAAPAFMCSARGKVGIAERLGHWNIKSEKPLVWFHGASAGEISGLIPIIERYKAAGGKSAILVTATTSTGVEQAAKFADYCKLLPFDARAYLNRALSGLKIEKFIAAETELWPGLLHFLHQKNIPAYLVNARISKYSIRRYQFFRPIVQRPICSFEKIICANQQSRDRFITLGAEQSKVVIGGNSKYDKLPSVKSAIEAQNLRAEFFKKDAPVLVLGSLRPQEEVGWFSALQRIAQTGKDLAVVIAPRHKEKIEYFASALAQAGLAFSKRSENQPVEQSGLSIILLDTFGELERIYSFADLVFIGATLVDIGGHNPLEAAAYGAAVAVGPYTSNVSDIVEAMEQSDGLLSVRTEAEILALLQKLLLKDPILKSIGLAGKQVWHTQVGAAERIAKLTGLLA